MRGGPVVLPLFELVDVLVRQVDAVRPVLRKRQLDEIPEPLAGRPPARKAVAKVLLERRPKAVPHQLALLRRGLVLGVRKRVKPLVIREVLGAASAVRVPLLYAVLAEAKLEGRS